MTEVKETARAAGSLFLVDGLQGLSDEPCNLLCVSDRTLYLMQRFALNEVTWLARYVESLVGPGGYVPVDASSVDLDFVLSVANKFRLEIEDMSCDLNETLVGIAASLSSLAECCAKGGVTGGQDVDSPPSDGTVPVGPGTRWPTETAYQSAKCVVANAIFDTLLATVTDIDGLDINAVVSGVFGGATAVIAGQIASGGVLGWAISKVSSVIVRLLFLMISTIVDFSDIQDALDAAHDEVVCALFEALDTAAGKTAVLVAVLAITPGLGQAEQEVLIGLLTNVLINQLFDPSNDALLYTSASPVDCDTCGGTSLCDTVPFVYGGVEHGSGDYTRDSSSRVISSVYDPALGLHYISFQIKAYNGGAGARCPVLAIDCPTTQNFQFQAVSYAGYSFAGHSANGLCDSGASSSPEIGGTGLPNPIGSWAKTTIIEWVSYTPWTLTCMLRDTP